MVKFIVNRSKLKPLGKCSKIKTPNGKNLSEKDPWSEWAWCDALSGFTDGQEITVEEIEEALNKSQIDLECLNLIDAKIFNFSFDPETNDFIFWSDK